MTKIYFIRHAQSDNKNSDNRNRPLTEKGMVDRKLVTDFLQDKSIDIVLSSTFKRAIDTVKPFAISQGLEIELIEDFREREADWMPDIADFYTFAKRQWSDFSYALPGDENLTDVQTRNIAAFKNVLEKYKDKNIAIGTHGTALSTIINYYDKSYGYDDFVAMVDMLPWAVLMEFDGQNCKNIQKINLFEVQP